MNIFSVIIDTDHNPRPPNRRDRHRGADPIIHRVHHRRIRRTINAVHCQNIFTTDTNLQSKGINIEVTRVFTSGESVDEGEVPDVRGVLEAGATDELDPVAGAEGLDRGFGPRGFGFDYGFDVIQGARIWGERG